MKRAAKKLNGRNQLNGLSKHSHRHPWQLWFARDRFRLVRGRDYRYKTSSMAQEIRSYVARHLDGVRVSIEIADDELSLLVLVIRPNMGSVTCQR